MDGPARAQQLDRVVVGAGGGQVQRGGLRRELRQVAGDRRAQFAGFALRQCVARGGAAGGQFQGQCAERSEEHTSELQSLMRISYAVFCLKKNKNKTKNTTK